MTSSFCIATGRRFHAMPVYGTSTMRRPDHARGMWGLRALNMTPCRGFTMCPHNKSRPQRIHAGREGPFAQSRALVNNFFPHKITQDYFPRKGTVILWMRMYKHGLIAHPMDHCERSIG